MFVGIINEFFCYLKVNKKLAKSAKQFFRLDHAHTDRIKNSIFAVLIRVLIMITITLNR